MRNIRISSIINFFKKLIPMKIWRTQTKTRRMGYGTRARGGQYGERPGDELQDILEFITNSIKDTTDSFKPRRRR